MSTTTANPLATNPQTEGPLWVEVTIPFLILTIFVVGVRVWWRRKIAGKITLSDISILVSLVSLFFCHLNVK